MISIFPDSHTLISFKVFNLNLGIKWYAVLIMTGVLFAYLFSKKEIKKARYIDDDFFDSLIINALWIGIIGARLWFCAFNNFSFYFSNPMAIIRIWDGGLAIHGGFIFALIFAYFYCHKHQYSFLKLADIVVPNVLLAQAFGRWGNFINQECHGAEVAESFFNGILFFLKDGMFINGHYYEPLFFYESILCLLGWFLINFVLRKFQNRRGDLTYAYLMWYGVIRFFIEGRRTDSLYVGSLKTAQLTSIVFLIIGLLGFFGLFNKILTKRKPTIVFDIDGTLIDTRESIWAGFEAVFKKNKALDLYTEEVKDEVIGPALREMFSKYFPDKTYDELYAIYKNKQTEVQDKTNKVTDNSLEVVKTLKEEGYNIAILSTRSHEGISDLLSKAGMSDYIDYICGLDDIEKTKPYPDGLFKIINVNKFNKDCIMIGDSLMDIECGKNYGAYTVGFYLDPNRKDMLDKNANICINDMKEVLDIVKKDISFTYNLK